MRLGKAIFLLLSVGFLAFPVSKSFGIAVTDSGSYTYYAEQISKMEKQLAEMQKQVENGLKNIEEVQKVQGKVMEVKDQLTGSYGQASGLLQKLNGIRAKLETQPSTMQAKADKWYGILSDDSGFVDPAQLLDTVFSDPRKARLDGSIYRQLEKAYGLQQSALKNTIEEADGIVQGMGKRYERLNELAVEIDKTENMKSAQDLTNTILIEIADILLEHLKLSAKYSEAHSMLNFSGIEDDVQEDFNRDQGTSAGGNKNKYDQWADKQKKEMGVSGERFGSDEEFSKMLRRQK